jgi:O-antigen/teichoic acid export membrane protein
MNIRRGFEQITAASGRFSAPRMLMSPENANMSESVSMIDAHRRDESASSVAASGTVQLLVARGFFMVSAFLSTVIAARALGPTDYGAYGIVMSVLAWIEIVASAGIPGAISRLSPRYAKQAFAFEGVAVGCLLIVSLMAFGLSWLFAPALAQFFHLPAAAILFRVAFLDIPFNGVNLAYQGMFNGYRSFKTTSVGIIIHSVAKLGGLIILFFMLGLSLSGMFLVNVLSTASALIYFGLILPPSRLRFDYSIVKPIFQIALPFSLILGCRQVLSNLDLWSLKSLGTESEVIGIYLAAGNIPKMLLVVPNTIGDVLFASLAWALVSKNEELAQKHIQATMRFLFVVLLPCCVLLVQDAEAIMTFLYSGVYASGSVYLRLQIIAVIAQSLLGVILVVFSVAEKYMLTVATLFSLILLSLVLNIGLIPQFGAIGAAISVILTNTIGAGIAAIFLYRRFGTIIRLLTVFRSAVATTLIALLSRELTAVGVGLVPKFSLLLGGYVLLLALLKELQREDLRGFELWRKDP